MVVAAAGAGDIGARAGTATRLFTIATFTSGTVTGGAATTEAAIVRPATFLPAIRRIALQAIPDMAGRRIHPIALPRRLFPRTAATAPTGEMQIPGRLWGIARTKHHLNCLQRLGTRGLVQTSLAVTNVRRRRILRLLQPHNSRVLMRSRVRVEDAHKARAEIKVWAAAGIVGEERLVDSD